MLLMPLMRRWLKMNLGVSQLMSLSTNMNFWDKKVHSWFPSCISVPFPVCSSCIMSWPLNFLEVHNLLASGIKHFIPPCITCFSFSILQLQKSVCFIILLILKLFIFRLSICSDTRYGLTSPLIDNRFEIILVCKPR